MAIKSAFKRLAELSQELRDVVDQKLLSGETPSSVASYLQDECKMFLDIQPGSLKKNLERYRASDLKAIVVNDIMEKVQGRHTSSIRAQFVALNELEQVCMLQKARVEKMIVKEKNLPAGVLLKQTTDELRLLKEVLVELGKMQLETGIGMKRAPKHVAGNIYDPQSGETKQFSWTEESERLLDLVEGIDFTRGDKKVIAHHG